MNDAVGALERLKKITRVAQVSEPARAEFFPRRYFVETENLIIAREQIAKHKLPQSSAATGHNDFLHPG